MFLQDPIPTSLLKINTDLVARATKLFQIILKYIGVDSSDRVTPASLDERIELVGKLYKQTLKRTELRDELFVQISKQTRNSPDRYECACVFILWMDECVALSRFSVLFACLMLFGLNNVSTRIMLPCLTLFS